MASPKDVLKQIADNEVKFVDFRFTDTVGREHHVSVPTSQIDEDKLESGPVSYTHLTLPTKA